MRLELTGRHVDITPGLRQLVNRKLVRLERMLADAAVSAQVVLTRETHGHRVDVTLHARGERFLHGDGEAAGWPTAMALAVDKLSQQAKRMKGKWQDRKRGAVKTGVTEASVAPLKSLGRAARPARRRLPKGLTVAHQAAVKQLSVVEATREIERSGLAILVFHDVDTAAISVVYRGPDGELALVTTAS